MGDLENQIKNLCALCAVNDLIEFLFDFDDEKESLLIIEPLSLANSSKNNNIQSLSGAPGLFH